MSDEMGRVFEAFRRFYAGEAEMRTPLEALEAFRRAPERLDLAKIAASRVPAPGDGTPDPLDWIIALRTVMGITRTESAWVGGRSMTYQEITAFASASPESPAGAAAAPSERGQPDEKPTDLRGIRWPWDTWMRDNRIYIKNAETGEMLDIYAARDRLNEMTERAAAVPPAAAPSGAALTVMLLQHAATLGRGPLAQPLLISQRAWEDAAKKYTECEGVAWNEAQAAIALHLYAFYVAGGTVPPAAAQHVCGCYDFDPRLGHVCPACEKGRPK